MYRILLASEPKRPSRSLQSPNPCRTARDRREGGANLLLSNQHLNDRKLTVRRALLRISITTYDYLAASLGDAGVDALPHDLLLELGEDCQHPASARRVGEVMSKASVRKTKPMPSSASSFKVTTRSGSERPQRSSRQTRIASTSRRRTAASNSSRFGLWSAPDPTSLISSATCKPRRWRTRAWI